MKLAQEKTVLLFYKDWEHDSLFPNDRYLKRLLRPIYHKFSKGPKVSGFLVWFQLLQKALKQEGYKVAVNDYRLAFSNPTYPVGLVGYPHLLDGWSLPNPAVLGPSLLDHPAIDPTLMEDTRYKKYLVTCDWMYDVFAPVYGAEQVGMWHAGIDTDDWQDTRFNAKNIDVLIYDKIRWARDHYEPNLLTPITNYLTEKGLTYEIVRYGNYNHESYREQLKASRSMIFLCEHETQGMAYQEALASNVPILAWDPGLWCDPHREEYTSVPVATCSVPYFSEACGEIFHHADEFKPTFDTFWNKLDVYEPRQYVQTDLSFKRSAEIYIKYYLEAAGEVVEGSR